MRFRLHAMIMIELWLVLSGAESKTHWGDIEVLKQLKQGLEAGSVTPGSCVSSWDFKLDPCDNLLGEKFTCGFRCDVVVSGLSRVTELALDQAGYSAPSLSFPWNLPFLQTLDLSNNYFFSQIPLSFSNLTRLRRLSLSSNSFSGQIPSSLASLTTLQELYLDNNHFTGPIPQSFTALVNLKRLYLQSNKLAGVLPDFSSLRNLYYLDLSDNSFSGTLPPSLPASLLQITIRNNNLTGELSPGSFDNATSLEVVDFSNNRLSGAVPSVLLELPSLQQLTLSFNEFSSIEASSEGRGSESGLIAVDLSNNRLRGKLPTFMARMQKLASLSLEKNELTGLIPVEFAWKTVIGGEKGMGGRLKRLRLGGNYFVGGIPRPLLALQPNSADISLVDNCLYRCPHVFFFCQGGQQKSFQQCHFHYT